jgi:hypothetical protein
MRSMLFLLLPTTLLACKPAADGVPAGDPGVAEEADPAEQADELDSDTLLAADGDQVVLTTSESSFASLADSVQPPPPCRPNPNAVSNIRHVAARKDVAFLPAELKRRILELAGRPHSQLPVRAFAEAASPSLLFQYYLLDVRDFEPNVFTDAIEGINDDADPTATGANCDIPTIGAVRQVVEPKPGLPVDPKDPNAFIDVFTDVSGLFVINNESGWYEGWMIHDLVVPDVAAPRADGSAQFGTMLAADAAFLAYMGHGHNKPGHLFTTDGKDERFPRRGDRFPSAQSNLVPIPLSMGAWNTLQQADGHAYWEFNYTTNWIFPLYELPVTGGFPDDFGLPPDAFEDGEIGARQSIIAGSGPSGVRNSPQAMGDDPNNPRDPDRTEAEDNEEQTERRMRFIPSGLANEVLLDVYVRRVSFEPGVTNLEQRLYDAYAAEVARVDENGDGVISSVEGDIEEGSDGEGDNERLFLPATSYNRFAVTREINDGLLAPRFAPSQRAWVMQGRRVRVSPAVRASDGRDSDSR